MSMLFFETTLTRFLCRRRIKMIKTMAIVIAAIIPTTTATMMLVSVLVFFLAAIAVVFIVEVAVVAVTVVRVVAAVVVFGITQQMCVLLG